MTSNGSGQFDTRRVVIGARSHTDGLVPRSGQSIPTANRALAKPPVEVSVRHQEPDEATAGRAPDRQADANAARRTDNEQRHDEQDIAAEEPGLTATASKANVSPVMPGIAATRMPVSASSTGPNPSRPPRAKRKAVATPGLSLPSGSSGHTVSLLLGRRTARMARAGIHSTVQPA